jgi:hypothetical protein
MRNTLIVAMLGATALWQAPSNYQPLNANTGLWETKTVITQSGQAAIPEDALARLTPEQRAKFQAAMQARLNAPPITRTPQSCLTTDELNNGSVFNPNKH